MSGITKLCKCNLCRWTGNAYLERDTALVCPRCFSRQRHRSIYRYLTEKKKLIGNACLDVASRRIFQRRLNYSTYINIDKVRGWADHVMDVCDLKFNTDSFDLIICCSVLQFVPDYKVALEEMHRVLKSTGSCIVQIPYCRSLKQTYLKKNATSRSNEYKARTEHELVRFSYNDITRELKKWFHVESFVFQDKNIAFSQQEFFVCNKDSN